MYKNKYEFILGFLIIIFVLYFGWAIISFFFEILKEIDKKTAATILGTMLTVFVSVSGLIYTQKQIKQREIDEALRTNKINVYNKFITISTKMIASVNENLPGKTYPQEKLIEDIFDFKKDLLVWGSPKVIKEILIFQDVSINKPTYVLKSINNLYMAMREDIGMSNKTLNRMELIKIFITNPTEVDKLINEPNKV